MQRWGLHGKKKRKKSFLRPVLAFVPLPSMNFLGPLPALTMAFFRLRFFFPLFYPLLFFPFFFSFFCFFCTWAGGCRTPQHARSKQDQVVAALWVVLWLEPGG